jgi:hypothetical protein
VTVTAHAYEYLIALSPVEQSVLKIDERSGDATTLLSCD